MPWWVQRNLQVKWMQVNTDIIEPGNFVKFRTLEPGVLSPHSALVGTKKSTSEVDAGEY